MFGEQDFVQYWTAFHFLIQGHNPYDVVATQALQCSLKHNCQNVLVSWNPPWLLILMAPVLWLPFGMAAKTWVIAGLGMSAGAALLIADCYKLSPRAVLYALVGVFINVPVLLSAGFGQTGALLLFGAALFVHGRVKTDSLLQQAVALVILAVKPHLFFLLGVGLLLDELRLRRIALIGYVAAILAAMIFLLAILDPAVLSGYLDHFVGDAQGDGAIGLTSWNTPTVGNVIRVGLRGALGHRADLFLVIIPVVSVFLLVWWCWRHPVPNWLRRAPPLFALSLWLAPYGWAYDWTVLGVLQAVLMVRLVRCGQDVLLWFAVGTIVLMQLGAGYVTFVQGRPLASLVWLPATELALWYGAEWILRAVHRPVVDS